MQKLREIWRRIDGPLGFLFLAGFIFNIGYLVRGYEDGGFVATLIERIHTARLDEREQCTAQKVQITQGYQERSKLRDAQVATLIEQNRVLIGLVQQSAINRSKALKDATEAANRAAASASSLDQKVTEVAKQSSEISQKTTELSKKLDTATQPSAVVPHKAWGK